MVGALVGGLVQRRFSFGAVIVATLVVQALLFPLLGIAAGAWTLGLVFGAMQFFGPIYNVVQFSHRIARIPDALQGRVNSSFRLIAFVLNPVGALVCGLLIERAGAGWALGFFAVVLMALAAYAALDPVIRDEGRTPAAGGTDPQRGA